MKYLTNQSPPLIPTTNQNRRQDFKNKDVLPHDKRDGSEKQTKHWGCKYGGCEGQRYVY